MHEKWTRARFGMHLGVISGVNLVANACFCWKNDRKNTDWQKRCPQQWNKYLLPNPGAPGQSPLKSKIVRVVNNNWTKNSNNSTIQQKPQQLQSCCFSSTVVVFVSCSIASVRLLLFLFPVRLLLLLCLVRLFFKSLFSDTPWARPGEFSFETGETLPTWVAHRHSRNPPRLFRLAYPKELCRSTSTLGEPS